MKKLILLLLTYVTTCFAGTLPKLGESIPSLGFTIIGLYSGYRFVNNLNRLAECEDDLRQARILHNVSAHTTIQYRQAYNKNDKLADQTAFYFTISACSLFLAGVYAAPLIKNIFN